MFLLEPIDEIPDFALEYYPELYFANIYESVNMVKHGRRVGFIVGEDENELISIIESLPVDFNTSTKYFTRELVPLGIDYEKGLIDKEGLLTEKGIEYGAQPNYNELSHNYISKDKIDSVIKTVNNLNIDGGDYIPIIETLKLLDIEMRNHNKEGKHYTFTGCKPDGSTFINFDLYYEEDYIMQGGAKLQASERFKFIAEKYYLPFKFIYNICEKWGAGKESNNWL